MKFNPLPPLFDVIIIKKNIKVLVCFNILVLLGERKNLTSNDKLLRFSVFRVGTILFSILNLNALVMLKIISLIEMII